MAGGLEKSGYYPGIFWAYVIILAEIVGGTFLALGLFTRLAAAVLIIQFINVVYVDFANRGTAGARIRSCCSSSTSSSSFAAAVRIRSIESWAESSESALNHVFTHFHSRYGFWFSVQGGGIEYPLMWAAVMLLFAIRGGGPMSVDARMGKEF